MSVQYRMPNGELVPVPIEIVAEGNAALQSFYDNQSKRIADELGISEEELHSPEFAAKHGGAA